MTSCVDLRTIPDNNQQNGSNFLDQYRNLQIVLIAETITYVFENPPTAPTVDAPDANQATYLKHKMDDETTCCIMLALMNIDLQK